MVNEMGDLLGGGGFKGEQGDEGGAANFLLDIGKSEPVSHDADAAGSADFLSRGQADGVVNEMGDLLEGGGFNGEQGDEVGTGNILLDLGKSEPVSHDADAAPKRKMPKRSSKFGRGKKRSGNCKIGRVTLVLKNKTFYSIICS